MKWIIILFLVAGGISVFIYVLASSDKAKWNSLYYLAAYDGCEADCVPIGTDLFGFLRKAEDPAFLKSLKKD